MHVCMYVCMYVCTYVCVLFSLYHWHCFTIYWLMLLWRRVLANRDPGLGRGLGPPDLCYPIILKKLISKTNESCTHRQTSYFTTNEQCLSRLTRSHASDHLEETFVSRLDDAKSGSDARRHSDHAENVSNTRSLLRCKTRESSDATERRGQIRHMMNVGVVALSSQCITADEPRSGDQIKNSMLGRILCKWFISKRLRLEIEFSR